MTEAEKKELRDLLETLIDSFNDLRERVDDLEDGLVTIGKGINALAENTGNGEVVRIQFEGEVQ